MNRTTALRIALAGVLLVAIVAAFFVLRIPHVLPRTLEKIHDWGIWGPVAVVVLYLLACLLLLPSTPLNLACGFLFGMLWGIGVASLGSVFAASAAFLLGRFLLRGWTERRLAAQAQFLTIDHEIGKHGIKIVLLVRLCTVFPFGLTSYVFGITRVSLGRFVLASGLGRLPQVILCACIGSTARSLNELATGRMETSVGEQVSLGLGLLAMAAVVILLTRIARKSLRNTLDRPIQSDDSQRRQHG